MEKIETILMNTKTHLQGKNTRLYWNDELEGFTGEITDYNRSIVCSGWNVIIWKGRKPVSIYFGESFNEALDAFEKEESQ